MPLLGITFFKPKKKDTAPLLVDARCLLTVEDDGIWTQGATLKRLEKTVGKRDILYVLPKSYIQQLIDEQHFSGTVADFLAQLKLSCKLSVCVYEASAHHAFMQALECRYTKDAMASAFFLYAASDVAMDMLSRAFLRSLTVDTQVGMLDELHLQSAIAILNKNEGDIRLLCDIDDTVLLRKPTLDAYHDDKTIEPILNPHMVATLQQLMQLYSDRKVTIQLITSRPNRPQAFKVLMNELKENPRSLKSLINKEALRGYVDYMDGKKPHYTVRVHKALKAALGKLGDNVTMDEPTYACSVYFNDVCKLKFSVGAFKYAKADRYRENGEAVVLFDNDDMELKAAARIRVPAIRVYDTPTLREAQWVSLAEWSRPVALECNPGLALSK